MVDLCRHLTAGDPGPSLDVLEEIETLAGPDSAPAEHFRLPHGTTFGIIASATEPFCGACDRSRLTADGLWLLCLYARGGLDLRHTFREDATREELSQLVRGIPRPGVVSRTTETGH